MTLEQYFKKIPAEQRTAVQKQLAKETKVTMQAVWHWRSQLRKPEPWRCKIIERFTGGKVRKETLQPAIYS